MPARGPAGPPGATGPAGPQGPLGPATAGPAGLDVVIAQQDGTGLAVAFCPPDHPYVIGGGFNDVAGNPNIIQSFPTAGPPGSWTVGASNGTERSQHSRSALNSLGSRSGSSRFRLLQEPGRVPYGGPHGLHWLVEAGRSHS